MDWGPIIGAGISAAGSIGGGLVSSAGQADANAMNNFIARQNREWSERMSNTAWQRGVEDMRKAGLNPALAYEKGGASVPTAGMARMENASAGIGAGIAQAGSSAGQAVMNSATLAQQTAQAEKTSAEAQQIRLESALRVAALEAQLRQTTTNTALSHQRNLTEKAETDRRWKMAWHEGLRYDLSHQQLDFNAVANAARLRLLGAQADYAQGSLGARLGIDRATEQAALLSLPMLRNSASAAETVIGRLIMPYLGTANAAANLFRSLK